MDNRKQINGKRITVNGKTYRSIAEYARNNNISYDRAYKQYCKNKRREHVKQNIGDVNVKNRYY